ncbi:hypothetical protein G9C98_000980 [Cotesia typhae]|uniref:Pre-mRNA-splicing regulator WTAP n=1 Tax=Cotesia typhae TaxID=2053667 RepID=A0A8J5UPX5_9HYME|nr:hypothetical protein G9C98_000980 [Cotesia typhae]
MAEESTGDSKQGQLSPRSPSGAGVAGGVVNKPTSPRSPAAKPTRRVRLTEQQLEAASKEELAGKWREQESYIEILEAQASAQEGELASLKESEEKFRQQFTEASYREKILVRRLTSKEQELQDYVSQITELKAAQAPSVSSLRSALLDPAVNILIQKLRQELITTKAKLEDTQNELIILSTIYFLQQELRKARESVTLLQQENLALKSLPNENNLSNGLSPHTPPIIKKEEEQDELENEVIMSKSLAIEPEEYKEVDEDGACTPPLKNQVAIPATQENDESSSDSAALIIKVENEELTDRENEEDESKSGRTLRRTKGAKCCSSGSSSSAGDKTNGDDSTCSRTTNALRLRDRGDCRTVDSRGDRERTKRDKSAHSSDEEQHHQIRDCGRLKKKRRESILSIDYNDADDDAIVLTNGETLQSDPE